MGIKESQPQALERKLTKTKSNLKEKSQAPEDISDFIAELSALSSLTSTTQSNFDYSVFQRLPFNGHFSPLPICTYLPCSNNSVFVCYECSVDNQAYLCENCFEKGNHDAHRFSIFPNNSGWQSRYCRCGDALFMKKNKLCEEHAEAPKIVIDPISAKDQASFQNYFNEVFKVLISLMEKWKSEPLLTSVFNNYLTKITDSNLYFSKILCEFLLQKNVVNQKHSNLYQILKHINFYNFTMSKLYRNLSLIQEHKLPILRQVILSVNQNPDGKNQISLYELILNFSGKIDPLINLAKNENLILGFNEENPKGIANFVSFYEIIITSEYKVPQFWKIIVNNNLVQHFSASAVVIKQMIKSLINDQQAILSMLSQFIKIKNNKYILKCLLVLSPELFLPSISNKNSKKNVLAKVQKQFEAFYIKMFSVLNTHREDQPIDTYLLLILPYFSFGQQMIVRFWQQIEKRVQVILRNKEKRTLRQAANNLQYLLRSIINPFMSWDHFVLNQASQFNLINYTKDEKVVEKAFVQFIDKQRKIPRTDLLAQIDCYTQKQRNIVKEAIKKNLILHKKKEKYYYISQKKTNNGFSLNEVYVGSPFKFSEWQAFVGKRFFTQSFYKMLPDFIKLMEKAKVQQIWRAVNVANIVVAAILLNKNHADALKLSMRNYIKQLPDVDNNDYFELAKIRDRLQLDDTGDEGKTGTKKPKLDLISQIRNKKFAQIKKKQQAVRLRWIQNAKKSEQNVQDQDNDENVCHICKQKQQAKRRFVYPCNFSRNNVISIILKSEVTDLDINICLHKIHEDCYEKLRIKAECNVCKFKINCYLPEKALPDESYSKNWLRNFENIVTRINMESGKSFNSDWSTIFLTYLIFSWSFKLLLKNSELQDKQRNLTDELILYHYRNQLQKWPDLTKNAMKKAQKTVKGQITRESNIKKVVKTLVLDLAWQQIIQQPFKNQKRVEKKFRQMINNIGTDNAQKIRDCFEWARQSERLKQQFDNNVSEQVPQLFKLKQFPQKASEYLSTTSIKCPECNKYKSTTWQCLFCNKISCSECKGVWNHCQLDHRGTGIFLNLHDARYQLFLDNRQISSGCLYRNQYDEGWTRNLNPEGWKANTDEIYKFYDCVLHSLPPPEKQQRRVGFGMNNNEEDSDAYIANNTRGDEEEEDPEEEGNEEEHDDENQDEGENQGSGEEDQEQQKEEEARKKGKRATVVRSIFLKNKRK